MNWVELVYPSIVRQIGTQWYGNSTRGRVRGGNIKHPKDSSGNVSCFVLEPTLNLSDNGQ